MYNHDGEKKLNQRIASNLNQIYKTPKNFERCEILKDVISYSFPNGIVAIECKNADVVYQYKEGEKIAKGKTIATVNGQNLCFEKNAKLIEIDAQEKFDYNFLLLLF